MPRPDPPFLQTVARLIPPAAIRAPADFGQARMAGLGGSASLADSATEPPGRSHRRHFERPHLKTPDRSSRDLELVLSLRRPRRPRRRFEVARKLEPRQHTIRWRIWAFSDAIGAEDRSPGSAC